MNDSTALSLWRRKTLLLVFMGYVALFVLVLFHHEAWGDEAEPWLLVRDAPLWKVVLHHLKYQGHTSFWYVLISIPAKLGLPYSSLKFISFFFATCGVYFFLRYSPFPTLLKVMLPFTFFIFFQYGILGRPYVFYPLLIFWLASLYHDRHEKVYRYTLALGLIANVTAHGFVIASCLAGLFFLNFWMQRRTLERSSQRKHWKAFGGLAVWLALVTAQSFPSKPTPWLAHAGDHALWLIRGLEAITMGPLQLNEAYTEVSFLSYSVLVIALFWFWQRKVLAVFLVPTCAILFFFSAIIYKGWHQGILILVLLFATWVSFSKQEDSEDSERVPPSIASSTRYVFIGMLAILFSVQIYWAAVTSYRDIKEPYSGGAALAQYIKSKNIHKERVYISHFYGTAALPYFKKIFYSNFKGFKPPPYWLWEFFKNSDIGDWSKKPPDYVVTSREDQLTEAQRRILEEDYIKLKIFHGFIFWKTWVYEENHLTLYKRIIQ